MQSRLFTLATDFRKIFALFEPVEQPADPGAFKAILTRVNSEGWRSLRLLAVEAFNDLVKKHRRRPNVEILSSTKPGPSACGRKTERMSQNGMLLTN